MTGSDQTPAAATERRSWPSPFEPEIAALEAEFSPCEKHGEGFICDHEKDVDYGDEF